MCRICPWWLGCLLVNPVRKLMQDPDKILRPYLADGMIAVDVGSGMGYFSLPMATLVGKRGKVICVDLQEKMLSSLLKRAQRAGVLKRIETRRAEKNSLNLGDKAGAADFVLAFAVVHEIPDQERLLHEICNVLKNNGILLLSEPKGHVNAQQFARTSSIAQAQGFEIAAAPKIWGEHSLILKKPSSL
jgi:ubiquinone/menaquinone biosynthesis C-methylase UbiE